MDLRFIKLRLCEADLLLVDDLDSGGADRDWARAARAMLDRRSGIGAQRLAVLSRSGGEFWLRVFDARGSRRAAHFDAALCATRWLLDSGKIGGDRARFRSGGGELVVDVLDGSSFGISLGHPLCLPELGELTPELAEEGRSLIEAGGERFEILPLALAPSAAARRTDDRSGFDEGPRAVAVFCEGGTRAVRARIGSAGRGKAAPEALPVRIIARGELAIGRSRDPILDAASRAAMALAASSLIGHADDEALVRSGGGGLWAERTHSGSLYVAGRPDYVFRGEFSLEDGGSA
jgi:diaminopimelate epimerase